MVDVGDVVGDVGHRCKGHIKFSHLGRYHRLQSNMRRRHVLTTDSGSSEAVAPAGAAELSRRAADAATAARRDYTSASAGALLSKGAERAMREGGSGGGGGRGGNNSWRAQLQQALPPVSPTERRQRDWQDPLQRQKQSPHSSGATARCVRNVPFDDSDGGSEDDDGAGSMHCGTDEWHDILQSQRQQDGAGLAAASPAADPAAASVAASALPPPGGSTTAPLSKAQPGSSASPDRRPSVDGLLCAGRSSPAALAASPRRSTADVMACPPSPAAAAPARVSESQVSELQMSEQEYADRELAERLQQEEAALEAERRRRSRELFLTGGSGLQRSRGPAKRLKAGPLDIFVRRH